MPSDGWYLGSSMAAGRFFGSTSRPVAVFKPEDPDGVFIERAPLTEQQDRVSGLVEG